MKKQLLGLCLLGSSSLIAQPTISNSIFPQAGDVWETSRTFDVSTFVVTPPASNATTWDFSTLIEDDYIEFTIENANTGTAFANYPDADILQELLPGLGGNAYVDVTATEVTTIAGGIDFFGVAFDAPFLDNQVTQIAPITYGTSHSDNFQAFFGEHIDSIPFLRMFLDNIASQFPFQVDTDSIRFNVDGNLTTMVDAHGTCILPNGTYNDVLRQKYEQYRETAIELRFVPPIGNPFWFDVTSIIASQAPIPVPESDTIIYYDHFVEGESQPIVRINMSPDDSQVTSVNYKSSTPSSVNQFLLTTTSPARFYPNPSEGNFNVDLTKVPVGDYQLEIMNIDGRTIHQQTVFGADHNWLRLDNSRYKGLFVCIIRDNNGAIIAQQRLTIQ